MSRKPWEKFPALQADYLIRVADILRRSRDSAARHAKRHLGDKLCSTGLVAFERSCHGCTVAATNEYREWLSVCFEDNHFVIKILGVPSRFYRGEEDAPVPARTLKVGATERKSIQTAFEGMEVDPNLECFRFEVVKTPKGFTAGVNFVEIGKDGTRISSWPIPKFVVKSKTKRSRKGAVELKPISLDDPKPEVQSDDATA